MYLSLQTLTVNRTSNNGHLNNINNEPAPQLTGFQGFLKGGGV